MRACAPVKRAAKRRAGHSCAHTRLLLARLELATYAWLTQPRRCVLPYKYIALTIAPQERVHWPGIVRSRAQRAHIKCCAPWPASVGGTRPAGRPVDRSGAAAPGRAGLVGRSADHVAVRLPRGGAHRRRGVAASTRHAPVPLAGWLAMVLATPLTPWLSGTDGARHGGRHVVELRLARPVVVARLELGNAGSAAVTVQVGRAADSAQQPASLLPRTRLMSAAECETWSNVGAVWTFERDAMRPETRDAAWDRLRIVCEQPNALDRPFGLDFVHVTADDEPAGNGMAAGLPLRAAPVHRRPPGYLFRSVSAATDEGLLPAAAGPAASDGRPAPVARAPGSATAVRSMSVPLPTAGAALHPLAPLRQQRRQQQLEEEEEEEEEQQQPSTGDIAEVGRKSKPVAHELPGDPEPKRPTTGALHRGHGSGQTAAARSSTGTAAAATAVSPSARQGRTADSVASTVHDPSRILVRTVAHLASPNGA